MALDVERTKLCNFLLENKAEEAKRILLQHNDLIFSKDDSGRAAIHWAATGGCLEIVQFCVSLDENAAADPDDSGWTPLMIACSAGRINVVKYLLNITVDVNVRNKNGQTPLHYAASKNYLQITSLLIENGADVNAQDKYLATPLHRAASQGHEKIVSLLLKDAKIKVDITDSMGCSALHLACEEGRENVSISLISVGANLKKQNKEKKTPLDLVEKIELAKKLIAAAEIFQKNACFK